MSASIAELAAAKADSQAAPGWGSILEPLADYPSHHPESNCAEVATACAASAASFSATTLAGFSDDLVKYVLALAASVITLAQTIYDNHAFDRMPDLADAMESAGCTGAEILDHCRGGGDHVRGCWVLDLVLGKR